MDKQTDLKRLVEINDELERMKILYKEMEDLVDRVVKDVGLEQLQYQDRYIQVVDNFANKNLSWKATAFRRFDVKITKV